MASAADNATGWLKFTALGLLLLMGGYVSYLIVEKLSGGISSIAASVSDIVQSAGATSDTILNAAGFSFSGQDASAYPGYKAGNWNKLMALEVNNPLSNSYKSSPFSMVNPGPTQVHAWAETIKGQVDPGWLGVLPFVGGNLDTVFNAFQAIPDQDNVNLVYEDIKKNHNFDLATDMSGNIVKVSPTSLDVIASIILSKPVTSINNQ